MAQGANAVGQAQPFYLTSDTGVSNSVSAPLSTASAGFNNLATSQVSVGTSATQIAAARAGRSAITITNITGAQQVYVGNAGVTTANGVLLPAAVGASVTVPFVGAVFGIAVTAAQTVSVMETY